MRQCRCNVFTTLGCHYQTAFGGKYSMHGTHTDLTLVNIDNLLLEKGTSLDVHRPNICEY